MAPKKTTPVTAPVQEVPKPTVEAPVVVPSTDVVEVEVVDKFVTVLEKLQSFASDLKELTSTVKVLQKEFTKLKNQKTSRKSKKAAGGDGVAGNKRQPSGFAKPTALSDQLCEFLGLAKGSSLARTEVTRVINQYVKTNNLQDTADKRMIKPDEKLKSIMTLKEGDKLTYFNLQSYIKHHFIKAA